jgi:tetratricopeptide (TPR) repeat protein
MTRHGPARSRALAGALALAACDREGTRPAPTPGARASILLVTLDTTRADAIGPEAERVETPAFDALAARGLRFRQAYASVPETLPSHASLLTGLHPAGHGVHENARSLPGDRPLVAERLRAAGYHTAAFVSAFVLARRFGLARGFEVYDDELPADRAERGAAETTARALEFLDRDAARPLFLWVHYFDPHAPNAPPEPFRARYGLDPYRGEVAAMDEQLGRLLGAFEERVASPKAVIVVADHGEGLGDHGESQHGHLLYQATMHVPLLIAGPGVAPGVSDAPVGTRRVFHTILEWAGLDAAGSLLRGDRELVLGEAMKPFLAYGWQPQVMAVEGTRKAIRAGRALEVYDVVADPREEHDLSGEAELGGGVRRALAEYPVPSSAAPPAGGALDADARERLASLGYVASGARPVARPDAPRPAAMVHVFELIEEASTLFVREEWARVVPLLERLLAQDPGNLDAALRLATALSSLGRRAEAEANFERARRIAPESLDVRMYRALHDARGRQWERAVASLEQVLAADPDRLPALEALAVLKERQGRLEEAVTLWQRIHGLRQASAAELVRLGELAMRLERTALGLESFEGARRLQGAGFAHDLELGVLYLAAGRYVDARDALDRVAPSHAGYAMALFKRAQVSVLLREPDRAARIERARRHADATTRRLIRQERLFRERDGP